MNEQDTIRIQAQLDSIRADLFSLKTEKELESYVVGRGADDFFGTANSVLPSSGSSRVITWGCTNVGLVITIKVGKVYFKGVSKSVGSTPDGWPNVTISSTTYGYLSMSLTDGTTTWGTSATDPGDGDDDTEIFRIFAATVADGKITELLECQHGDIRSMGNA